MAFKTRKAEQRDPAEKILYIRSKWLGDYQLGVFSWGAHFFLLSFYISQIKMPYIIKLTLYIIKLTLLLHEFAKFNGEKLRILGSNQICESKLEAPIPFLSDPG